MNTAPPIRILIVEDNLLTRLGLSALIETQSTLKIVGVAENGAKAIKLYQALSPDVVVCDLRMPGLDGFQTLALLRREQPPARVLVLSNHDGEEDVFRALQAGALGYLTKEADSAEVLAAIRAVALGQPHVPPELAARHEARVNREGLNAREIQVLERIAAGQSNREIAAGLSLSVKTVEMYVTAILGKLGAESRTGAVVLGIQRGLVTGKPKG